MKKNKVYMALLLSAALAAPSFSLTAAETDLIVSDEDDGIIIGDSDFDVMYPDSSGSPTGGTTNPAVSDKPDVTPGSDTGDKPDVVSGPGISNPSDNPAGGNTDAPDTDSLVRKNVALKNVNPTSNAGAALGATVANSQVLYSAGADGHAKLKFSVPRVGTVGFYINSGSGYSYKLYSPTTTVTSGEQVLGNGTTGYAVLKKGTYILEITHSGGVDVRGIYFKNNSAVSAKKYVPAKKKKTATITLKFKKSVKGSRIIVKKGRYDPSGNWESPLDVEKFSTIKKNALYDKKVKTTKMKIKVKKNGVYTVINSLNGGKVKTVYTFRVKGLKK